MCVGERMKECKSEREDQSVHLGDRERERMCAFLRWERETRDYFEDRERERARKNMCVYASVHSKGRMAAACA